jgi:hypothetical protein
MNTLEKFDKMFCEADCLSLDQEDDFFMAPCEINIQWPDVIVSKTKDIEISFNDFTVHLTTENISKGTFDETGMFTCDAIVNWKPYKFGDENVTPETITVKTEIKFMRMTSFSPKDIGLTEGE